jgi:hypothetical protein
MNHAEASETNLLDAVVSRYKAEGFEVFIHPSRAVLPPFLKDYRPDAVAIGPQRKIAIELVRSNAPSSDKISRLRELFLEHHDWELFVLYVSPHSSAETMPIAARGEIEKAVVQVGELRSAGQQVAALVMGWATLEAVARALLPEQLARSQPPARLIEVLASEGFLTPSEADALRPAASVRNAAAHGQLDVNVDPKQLAALVSALRMLTKFLPKDAA